MILEQIPIRSIQHYMYCPHRWGLIEIGDVWAENAFVTKANLIHERVHDEKNSYTSKNKKVYTSVAVYNDEYGIYGITDCIEVKENSKNGENEYNIVEYKPTKPKYVEYNEEDAMQLFAQKLCVDNVFNTNCKTVLYYADVKQRVNLDFSNIYEQYSEKLKNILNEIRKNIEYGIIPKIDKTQKCNGCSFKDLCIPKIKYPLKMEKQIRSVMEGI